MGKENLNKFDKKVNTQKEYENKMNELMQGDASKFLELLKIADKEVIENLGLQDKTYEVVIILGEYELVYDSGSFFIEPLNINGYNKKKKKKITNKEAKELFVQWMVRHNINKEINNKKQIKTETIPSMTKKTNEVKINGKVR